MSSVGRNLFKYPSRMRSRSRRHRSWFLIKNTMRCTRVSTSIRVLSWTIRSMSSETRGPLWSSEMRWSWRTPPMTLKNPNHWARQAIVQVQNSFRWFQIFVQTIKWSKAWQRASWATASRSHKLHLRTADPNRSSKSNKSSRVKRQSIMMPISSSNTPSWTRQTSTRRPKTLGRTSRTNLNRIW